MFILDPLNVLKWRWQQQRLETQQGMEMGLGIKRGRRSGEGSNSSSRGLRRDTSRASGMFYFIYYSYVFFFSNQRNGDGSSSRLDVSSRWYVLYFI
jgi:hypothetical protein